MNKTMLIFAIFAFCLAPSVLSADMKDNVNNKKLAGVSLTNLTGLIGEIVGALKNQTKNSTIPSNPVTSPTTNNTIPTTPVVNNTTPVANNTTPVVNTTTPVVNKTTPVVNNTTPVVNTTTPVVNNTTPVVNTTTPTTNVKYAKNDVDMTTFPADCLSIHNQQRVAVGVANLTWSASLAASAQTWAENMAVNGFRHSGTSGENIASSTYSTDTLGRLLGLWTKEQSHFIVGCTYPSCSSTSGEVGHYTQMVWAKTTQVGCGFAPGANRSYNYLCCQYYKAGNVIGQTVYPVTSA